jgi:hypothetical protein
MSKNLVGQQVRIISDNENYEDFRNEVLICTHASNKGLGYDSGLYPEMLCDFKCQSGREFPFALYEYEFEII